MRVSKIASIYDGDIVGFNSRACYNHLRGKRDIQVEGGDAEAVLAYFRKKVASNPQFFYSIQMDETGAAVNFFWVDDRSRAAYHYFGDVITFDTTYRTNKYKMPFAPFTGVNHHLQSIQFGCALMQDETAESFKWVFETWLEAMGGHAPNAIITDQDLAMKIAIVEVLPDTRYRLCIGHIKKKFGEKLSHVYYKKSKFKKDVKKLIWFTYKKEDFEDRWMELMKEYGLENNEWLQQLYAIRESWVPVYNRGTFFAGMNTTGRSEDVNSFFNEFVNPDTNLIEFVVRYNQALKRIVRREMDEDYESEHKYRIVEDDEFLLKHAASVYTRNVFNKFKAELKDARKFKVEEMINRERFQLFVVKSKIYDSEKFIVSIDLQSHEGNCECQNFEFVGILCKHMLKVFIHKDIDKLPEHFIVPRWRQKANIIRTTYENLVEDNGTEEARELMISRMNAQACELVYVAAESHERYRVYSKYLTDLRGILLKIPVNKIPDIPQSDVVPSPQLSQILISDPNISQTKGRTKDGSIQSRKRFRSGIESGTSKNKRHYTCCNQLGYHDKRTCPENRGARRGLVSVKEASRSGEEKEFVRYPGSCRL
ncbi:hypothetical protein LUZ60_002616 [Juncus effusus]|nr:hypothetical protein LUZ60_002616 [Juncus effusus]